MVCISENMINIVCDGPTCKGKEASTYAGGGSEGQKNNVRWLAFQHVSEKKESALFWGLCA